MNFKDALIAHLNGEAVEFSAHHFGGGWVPFLEHFGGLTLGALESSAEIKVEPGYTFRIKPRTVICNGVQVPAPESVAPAMHTKYWAVTVDDDEVASEMAWGDDRHDNRWLKKGLVYLNKEDAIARAKAMLITS